MVAIIKLYNLCMYLLDSQDGRLSRYEQSCQHYTTLQYTCMCTHIHYIHVDYINITIQWHHQWDADIVAYTPTRIQVHVVLLTA